MILRIDSSRSGLLRSTVSTLVLTAALTGTAFAQATGGTAADSRTTESMAMEVITVTSQKTAQDMQKVPIAVTAFTADQLETKGISDVSELANSTPNVTFDAGTPFSGSTAVLSAYIRGIGQNDFAFNQDPGVGVYLDGVYLARSVGANTDLLDVERVEILKGPQGDLFGRNTIGGAVSIITRDPGDQFAYKAEVTGGSYDRLDVRGYVDVPLAEDLSAGVSFSEKHQEGYLKRIPFPTSGPLYQEALTASGLLMSPAQSAAAFGPGSPAGDCYGKATCPTIVDPTTAGLQAAYQSSDREGGTNEWNGRAKVVWHASEGFKVTLSADYTNQDGPGQAMRPIAINANYLPPGANPTLGNAYNTCIGSPAGFLTFLSTLPGVPNFPALCGQRGTPGSTYAPSGAAYADRVAGSLFGSNFNGNPNDNRLAYGPWFVTDNIDTSYSTGNTFSKLKQYGASVTLDWNLADDIELKSVTALRGLHWQSGMDADGSPLNIFELSFDEGQQQWSQELQATGTTFGSHLDYVVGAYYFHEAGHIHDYVTFPGLLLQVDGQNQLWTTSYAGYFHFNYHVTDALSLIVGGRYTKEDKSFIGGQQDPNALVYKIAPLTINVAPAGSPPVIIPLNCYNSTGVGDPITNSCRIAMGFPDPNNPLSFYPPGVHKLSFDNFAPHLGLEYQVTDDDMVYATYSEGFKTGSWTTRLSSPHPTYDSSLHFDPEKARSGEIGVKTQFYDNKMRLNAAAFYTKYKGIQLNFQIGVSPTLLNAGDASIYGGELEYTALLSNNLTLAASAGYTHAQYDSVTPGAGSNGVLITTATKLPKTPTWKFNISPQYTVPLKTGSLLFNLDYTYTSSLFNDTQNTAELGRPATNMLNMSVTYQSPSDRWELSVGGTNLTDDRYIVTGANQGGVQDIYGSYNAPREWMATLRIKS